MVTKGETGKSQTQKPLLESQIPSPNPKPISLYNTTGNLKTFTKSEMWPKEQHKNPKTQIPELE